MIPVADSMLQNIVFFTALAVCIFLFRGRDNEGVLGRESTMALKGFAILAVIFSHIGYFLVADHSFLFPLSTLAGVGVDIFLLLSGFGLTMSALSKNRPVLDFYLRHAKKVYLPMWIVVAILFLADFFLLGHTYSAIYIAHTFAGFFPSAGLWTDVNSPLWFFTLILWFYFLFPLLFSRRRPWASAIAIATLSSIAVGVVAPLLTGIGYLYTVHTFAFPLGMLLAWLYHLHGKSIDSVCASLSARVRLLVFGCLFGMIWFFAIRSAVGTPMEQYGNLGLVGIILLFFALQRTHSRLLVLLGTYSYEIYLLHWPLISRYDILYATLPVAAATALYIALFIALAYLLHLAETKLLLVLARQSPSR